MFKVKVDHNLSNMFKNTEKRTKKTKYALTQQVLKDSNYYIPMDSGALMVSGVVASDFENGKVIWDTPYARKLYWNPQYNFSTDFNPNARGLWFEEAKARRGRKWRKFVKENY